MKPPRPKLESPPNPIARIDGRDYLYFIGTGYLGLQGHPEVIRAACEAVERYGLHAATSRTGLGSTAPLLAVEQRAAEFFGCEDAVYFAAGYAGNIILLRAIENDFDAIFVDESSHFCVFEAIERSGRPVFRFRCRDAADLAESLRQNLKPAARPLVITDGVFTGQGTIAPLPDHLAVLDGYAGAGLAIDDAHGVGAIGRHGRGTFDHFGLFDRVNRGDDGTGGQPTALYLAATLSKALGGYGGIIPGSERFVERVRKASHWYEGSNSPPAPVTAASARALELILADPDCFQRLRANVRRLREGLRALGFEIDDSPAPIVCLVAGDAENMQRIKSELMAQGIAVPYRAGYSGMGPAGCIRLAVFATHTEAMIRRLLDALRQVR
jgi:8-amino-7-oxononanoate synthase